MIKPTFDDLHIILALMTPCEIHKQLSGIRHQTVTTDTSLTMNTLTQSQTYSYNDSMFSLGSPSVSGSEVSSDGTAITSSTIPGLGEISGRAILALGKFTLRGAEYLVIRRRLDTISANFPHRNANQITGIEQMYNDILELSRFVHARFWPTCWAYSKERRDLYHEAIRARALSIILVQIGSRQTRHLVKCLLDWPFIETKIFISELTALLDPLRCVGIVTSPVLQIVCQH